MTTLSIYRPPSTFIIEIDIDEKTIFSKKLMGDWSITCDFNYGTTIDLQIGDYIVWNGDNYYINRLPDIVKINESTFQYRVVFQSVFYELSRKLYISSDGLADFSYNGSATDFITNVVAAINEISPGWTVGSVDASEDITLQFANETCMAVLVRVAQAFKFEFEIISKTINLKKVIGSTTSHIFEYGRGVGLYKLERQQVSDQNILTKVYGFGGTKNIPYTYRSGAKRLVFDAGSGVKYLTKNDDLYGIIEGQFTDDNIYPQRTSTLTGVNYSASAAWNNNTDYMTDSAMDFDLNSYLIEGQTVTIVFKSGDLSGIECEIWKYDNATKRFYINAYTDTDGATRPDTLNHPHSGDSYTLVNISMPQSYVDTAETALEVATQAYLDENCVPMVVYSVDFDPKYAKTIYLSLNVGDKVTITDLDLGIDTLIRIAAIEYPLVNPYKIRATIADFVPYTLQERIIRSTISTIKETIFVDRRSAESARRNTVRQNQMKDLIFDTDGYFDAGRIKPLSIETMYLSVGSKSSDFWLSGVTIKANYLGDINRLYVSAGSLVHLQIEITGLGYTWVIGSALDQSSLTAGTAYYLYARCSKSALTGNWVLSSSQITVESETGYYHFLVGMLFAAADGYRDFDFNKGMTYIHGDQIKTGTIESIDGENYLNLTDGKFRVGDASSSLDWNVTSPGVLTLRGALVQSQGGGTSPIMVSRGPYDAGTTYYIGESVTYGGSTWNWINATPASGHTPAENAYWTLASAGGVGPQGPTGPAGADGADGANGSAGPVGPAVVYRGDFSASTDYFNSSVRRDIVKNFGTYYLFKGTDGTHGAWSSGNWESFGATFTSVATDILFASLAYIDNLGVKYFNGVAVPAGDLAGSVVNTQTNQVDIFTVSLTGSSGTANIECNGTTHLATFNSTISQTLSDFVASFGSGYSGITLAHTAGNDYFTFTGIISTCSVTMVTPDLHASSVQHTQYARAQIDTITLTGTNGTAKIYCNDIVGYASFIGTSLTNTATNFVALYYDEYYASGVVLSSSVADIIFTALVPGTAFIGYATYCINYANFWQGGIKIEGNEIWENAMDDDTHGYIVINRKGYDGGATRDRHLLVGNGKGGAIMACLGTGARGSVMLYGDHLFIPHIPIGSTYCATDEIYVDASGFLKRKT
jgi:hypothetical protein